MSVDFVIGIARVLVAELKQLSHEKVAGGDEHTVCKKRENNNMNYTLHHGDNREVLKTFADNSIDSIVTDPPYELGFMGKKWDSTGIAYDQSLWAECLRVLKPGGHLLAFGGSRTYHRLAVAIEDAGFEVRDCIMWLYGSGFPKSLNVSKALDATVRLGGSSTRKLRQTEQETGGDSYTLSGKNNGIMGEDKLWERKEWNPTTDLAQQWQGWGTALKPAHEPIVVARKPLHGTVADNVTAWGVGALNIDGCRVGTTDDYGRSASNSKGTINAHNGFEGKSFKINERNGDYASPLGRWPANVILDEDAGEALDAQSGVSVSNFRPPLADSDNDQRGTWQMRPRKTAQVRGHSDSGGASRFFYVAKSSKAEREAGLDGMDVAPIGNKGNGLARVCATCGASTIDGCECENRTYINPSRLNHHPTVKPITLMRYLVRLVTPPNGTVLDPFMGSGSTGCAAMLENMQFVGIELNEEYVKIASNRIEFHEYTMRSKNPMGI